MRKIAIIAGLGAVACLAVPMLAGVADQGGQTMAQPPYVHTVVFYLKKDTPGPKVEALIADCHSILAKIPTVRSLWAGRPAAKATPDLAVKDYQVALAITFDNFEGLKTYLDHPTHLAFVQTYSPFFEKALIYDFENQAK
jgi:hypothetical protein